MHNFQIQALIFFVLGTISAVASSADMLTTSILSSLMSNPDISVQVPSSAAEGNTKMNDFNTEATVISSATKQDNSAAILTTQPPYCPSSYLTMPLCEECGGFYTLYFKEVGWFDVRCRGDGNTADLKDCSCLERRYEDSDDIVCDIIGEETENGTEIEIEETERRLEEVMALVPESIVDPVTGAELSWGIQPHIDLENDFWGDGQDDDEQEGEGLLGENV